MLQAEEGKAFTCRLLLFPFRDDEHGEHLQTEALDFTFINGARRSEMTMLASLLPKSFAGVSLIVLTSFLLIACDEVQNFTFSNETDVSVRVEWFVVDDETQQESGDGDVLLLGPGEVVSTEEIRGISGDRGSSIFYKGLFLRVTATSNGTVIMSRVYSYEELERSSFHVTVNRDQPP